MLQCARVLMPGRGNVRQFRVISPAISTIRHQANHDPGDNVNHIPLYAASLLAMSVLLAGCISDSTTTRADPLLPETLTVREDGSIWFRERPIPERDVIIYADGTRGEKAAVRIHMRPLHPDFFRDTIVVERE